MVRESEPAGRNGNGRLMMRLLQFGGKRAVGLNQGERGSRSEYWAVLDPSIGRATGIC